MSNESSCVYHSCGTPLHAAASLPLVPSLGQNEEAATELLLVLECVSASILHWEKILSYWGMSHCTHSGWAWWQGHTRCWGRGAGEALLEHFWSAASRSVPGLTGCICSTKINAAGYGNAIMCNVKLGWDSTCVTLPGKATGQECPRSCPQYTSECSLL